MTQNVAYTIKFNYVPDDVTLKRTIALLQRSAREVPGSFGGADEAANVTLTLKITADILDSGEAARRPPPMFGGPIEVPLQKTDSTRPTNEREADDAVDQDTDQIPVVLHDGKIVTTLRLRPTDGR
jgi:hypothetical protein